MSNKFARSQAPLPNFKPPVPPTLPEQISRSARNDGIDNNSTFKTQNSKFPDPAAHSALRTQHSALPREHPLAPPSHPRIDLLHGGSQHSTTRDSLLLAHQALAHLAQDEHVLILNSICAEHVMAEAAQKLTAAYGKKTQARILAWSVTGIKLREKFEFLTKLVVEKQVRLLIVNCWEFAAHSSRQKHALAQLLRELRDAHGVRIVIYSIEQEIPRMGALMLLAWLADRVMRQGRWESDHYVLPNSNQTVLELLAELAPELPNDPVETPKQTDDTWTISAEGEIETREETARPAMTRSHKEWNDKLSSQPAPNRSTTKNNDLHPLRARARQEELEEEVEEVLHEVGELEMA